MKISFLFFFLAMCSTISSETDERFPTVKSDEIRGNYIKYIRDASDIITQSNFKHLILKHLIIDPLPSCPKDCPLCHNHCVLTQEYCKEQNCTLVFENNVTLPVCSLGCWKGLCPDTSISVKFYGKIIFTAENRLNCNN